MTLSRGKDLFYEIMGRIKSLKDLKTDQEVAGVLGLKRVAFSERKRRGSLPYDELVTFSEREGVSVDWILFGRGAKEPSGHVVRESAAPYRLNDLVCVPLYNVAAAAGYGAEVPTEQVMDVLAFRREWVRAELGVDPAQLAVISVTGDSMEPTLRAGDLAVIDRRESMPAHDGLYVVRIGNGLVVKRVQLLPGGALVLRSEHPAYQPLTIRLDETGEQIAVVGRVVWVGRKV